MDVLQIIQENKSKFLHFNSLKFQRFQELLPNINVKRIVNAIPFLLSINHKKLPGYIEGDVPIGIVGYTPDDETKKFIKAKYPTVKVEIDTRHPFIQMLAVMGSIGTVAYNKKSDFDYWVCIDKSSTSSQQLLLFTQKVEAIQKWATSELEVPVHLFVNDIESIRNNIFAEDEEEAFGTTIGAVLKDEFFRSSIIIAGKIPFWWVVPYNTNAEYDKLYAQLPPEMKENDFIDLGNLYEISKEDFLGSALFQIIKSLGNPFKSIIKLGVLEKYLFGGGSSLLSQKIKINVLDGKIDDTILDSYLFMFREVYDYYSKTISEPSLLDILKINLYLKADPQISKYAGVKDPKNIPYKVKVMLSYAKEWKWTMKEIKDLDNFDNWDFNKIMEFWDRVTRFMILSYQNISQQLPQLNLQTKISESDFMLLSRKIKTHFRREKDKIDHHITFKDTPGEPILYIEPLNHGVQNPEWRLYKRDRSESDTFVATTIKTDSNLLKLLAWAALNRIYIPSYTRLNLQSGYHRINQNAVIELLNLISTFFTNEKIKIKNEYYLSEAFNLVNMLIINFNIENADEIKTIHHLYVTSWGESFLKEYNSEQDFPNILKTILSDAMKINKSFDDYLLICSPETYKKFYKNIIATFKDAYNHLIEHCSKSDTRFITRFGNRYYLFTKDGNSINYESFNSIPALLTSISLKPKAEISYRFYGDDQRLNTLQTTYQHYKPFALTIIVEETSQAISFYIINEKGNLFFCTKSIKYKDICLLNLFNFCNKISLTINKAHGRDILIKDNFKIIKLKTDKFENANFTDITKLIEAEFIGKFETDDQISLVVYQKKGEPLRYQFTLPGKHTCGPYILKEISLVAKKILELQKERFVIYPLIREIAFRGTEIPPTTSTQYFFEKFKVEYILEKCFSQTQLNL
ncbi:MAG: class I adenylate cyclase [Spirochaetes bacterium]|nr:class I adenylate cyclase [Spirochaetota bacterium]